MIEKSAATHEILRHTNHDWMNHLQVIQMYLDLERVDEAKQVIRQLADHCKTLSTMARWNFIYTAEWLQTFPWHFQGIELSLLSQIEQRVPMKVDQQLANDFEQLMTQVYEHLDPFTDQHLYISLQPMNEALQCTVLLKGKWTIKLEKIQCESSSIQWLERTAETLHVVITIR